MTEIVASSANRTFTITLKSMGETVLKVSYLSVRHSVFAQTVFFQIWNDAEPSQNAFIRLSALEMLYSSTRKPLVSDIVCFTSPLVGTSRWGSTDDLLEWLDVDRGIARLAQPGSTYITVRVAEQKLTASVSLYLLL